MTREEAIKYLEQHGFIDDVVKDMCIEALEKQIPMRIKEIHVDEYYCPACGTELNCDDGQVEDKYCSECGQALDWTEEGE